jgi:hypothetical protein
MPMEHFLQFHDHSADGMNVFLTNRVDNIRSRTNYLQFPFFGFLINLTTGHHHTLIRVRSFALQCHKLFAHNIHFLLKEKQKSISAIRQYSSSVCCQSGCLFPIGANTR